MTASWNFSESLLTLLDCNSHNMTASWNFSESLLILLNYNSTMPSLDVIALTLSSLLLYSVLKWFFLRARMPPGPLGIPFIGNRYQIPGVKPWVKFAEWNRLYGPVTSIVLGSEPVIVLGTAQAASDLFEKRSEIYSSRPRFVVAGEILSDNMRGLMLPYGDKWRQWRKLIHQGFNARKSESYLGMQSDESKVAMYQISTDPQNYEQHLQRYAASVATSSAYGRRVNSVQEWVVKENMEAMDYLTSVSIPGKYLVESWPWLLKLPRSLQWFRREPEERRQRDIKFLMHMFNDVKSRMQDGTCPDCLASQAIANMDGTLSDLQVAYSLSTPFGAGIETTAGTLSCFILAMLHFPEVMKKAQAELDQVVGHRLPAFSDRENLPYVNAVVNETLRWRPIAVLGGTPHSVTENDVYNGMFIPAGSTVFANLYGIMQDPVLFPEPDLFRPERFIETTDPRLVSFDLPFGFGKLNKRACPGKPLALNSLFINISRILWAFNIRPALDEAGNEIIPDSQRFTDGFNSRPVSFPCAFLPRSKLAAECVTMEYIEAKDRLGIEEKIDKEW
ncbi:cytochrome P450 [Mycena floridula]|nr:cytochrome P450 [Mycena floridula]